MALNIVRFDDAGTPRWGVVTGSRVQTLALAADSTAQLMEGGIEIARAAAASPAPDRELAELRLLCPVTADRQLICQGLNYASHLREIGIASGRLPYNTSSARHLPAWLRRTPMWCAHPMCACWTTRWRSAWCCAAP